MDGHACHYLELQTEITYHALFVILKKQQKLKLSFAANDRWRFKG